MKYCVCVYVCVCVSIYIPTIPRFGVGKILKEVFYHDYKTTVIW